MEFMEKSVVFKMKALHHCGAVRNCGGLLDNSMGSKCEEQKGSLNALLVGIVHAGIKGVN